MATLKPIYSRLIATLNWLYTAHSATIARLVRVPVVLYHGVGAAAPMDHLSTATVRSRQAHIADVPVPMEVTDGPGTVVLIELHTVVHLGHTDLPLAVDRHNRLAGVLFTGEMSFRIFRIVTEVDDNRQVGLVRAVRDTQALVRWARKALWADDLDLGG